jgi:hypothetical protein
MHFTTSLFVGCDRTCGMNCGKLGRIGPAEKRPPCEDALGASKSVAFRSKEADHEHNRGDTKIISVYRVSIELVATLVGTLGQMPLLRSPRRSSALPLIRVGRRYHSVKQGASNLWWRASRRSA